MKKTLLTIYLVAIMCIGIGCKKSMPTEYNPKLIGWNLWASGVIDEFKIEMDGTKRIFVIEFADGSKFKSKGPGDEFYNWDDIKEKIKGSVYRWDKGFSGYIYMWKSVENIKYIDTIFTPLKTAAKTFSTPAYVELKATTPTKYKWHNASIQYPAYGECVVIEFKNGTLTMGYYTRIKEWKADVDRTKMSKGQALKNVIRWKLIDLE